jgi:hypothetical protein
MLYLTWRFVPLFVNFVHEHGILFYCNELRGIHLVLLVGCAQDSPTEPRFISASCGDVTGRSLNRPCACRLHDSPMHHSVIDCFAIVKVATTLEFSGRLLVNGYC